MFEGFRPETIDFLWGIRFNNEKSWFEAHKQEYLDYLYNPMKELAAAVYEPLQAEPGPGCPVCPRTALQGQSVVQRPPRQRSLLGRKTVPVF